MLGSAVAVMDLAGGEPCTGDLAFNWPCQGYQRHVLTAPDAKQSRQARSLEELVKEWANLAQHHPAAAFLERLVQGHELTQHAACQTCDLPEVQHEQASAFTLDQVKQLFSNEGDNLILQNGHWRETNDRHAVHLLDGEWMVSHQRSPEQQFRS
jgi:hypothetical protein